MPIHQTSFGESQILIVPSCAKYTPQNKVGRWNYFVPFWNELDCYWRNIMGVKNTNVLVSEN